MPGIFILSLDTEIAWGTYGPAALVRLGDHFDNYRVLVRRLLALLALYQIPATWAVVGHLFLESCEGHPDVLMPDRDRDRDPCTGVAAAPWYYGPDVIEMIREAQPSHELGTHTFTHVVATEVSPRVWDSQLTKCVEMHAAHGLTLRSLVHPEEQEAHIDRLPSHGIIAYRGTAHQWHRGRRDVWGRIGNLLHAGLALPPPVYDPAELRVGDRLVNLPASQFLMSYDGVRRRIPTAARVSQARAGLARAARRGQLYHLWFHPFNLGSSDAMFGALEYILAEAARLRDAGALRVMTMGRAARWILDGLP